MSKQVYFRQCRMRKDYKDGSSSEQVSYIPEPYCVKGKVLKLRDSKDIWENGWVVTQVSELRVADDKLPDTHKSIKGHRQATGDAMKN